MLSPKHLDVPFQRAQGLGYGEGKIGPCESGSDWGLGPGIGKREGTDFVSICQVSNSPIEFSEETLYSFKFLCKLTEPQATRLEFWLLVFPKYSACIIENSPPSP